MSRFAAQAAWGFQQFEAASTAGSLRCGVGFDLEPSEYSGIDRETVTVTP